MRVVSVTFPGLLPQARVLARSLHRHEADWQLEVALIGSAECPANDSDELEVVSLDAELDIDTKLLLARYEPMDLVRLLIPRFLAHRSRGTSEPLLHLPPTTFIVDDLEPLAKLVKERGVLLAPRLSGDVPSDGLEPSREQLAKAGRLVTELIGVDSSASAQSFLQWWVERAGSVLGPLDGRSRAYGSEDWEWLLRMFELAPTRFSVGMLEDPGCNVSVWNLHERVLSTTSSGRVIVDGRWPLRFMDLAGFEPDHPYRLSATSSRVRVSRLPALRAISERYARELIEAGCNDHGRNVSVGGRLANGLVFDTTMAHLHATAGVLGEDFGDLFSVEGSEAFTAWLREPVPPWTSEGISRYVVQRVILERDDVTAAFPGMYGTDSSRFASWWNDSGRREMDVPDELLASSPTPVRQRGVGDDRRSTSAPSTATPRRTPTSRATVEGGEIAVRVTGYLSHILGLGSAARGYAEALAAAGVTLSTVSVPLDHLKTPPELSSEYGRHNYTEVLHEGGHGFELLCVNADELPQVVDRLGENYFRGPRIGVWGWETNSIPPRWKSAFSLVDEIWVYSEFMARNIGAVSPVPVIPLPPPIKAPSRNRGSLRLGVPNGFLFLFVFDYLSTIQRKNPVGLIEAFKRAFAPGVGPQLLVKTLNAPLRPMAEEEVLWAAEGRPDIHVLDRSLTADEKDALMLACDCYVSLHRSEGFGLTLAEAMAIGKPVIGTGYSGNVDFMNDENSFLVEYEICRVGPGNEIYPADGEWADPNLEHAARLMRRVYDDPRRAAQIGAQAREDIAGRLSPEATGAAMRRRLQEVAASNSGVRAPGSTTSIHS